ncbi:membrane hypothetical protein [Planktothrix sp. PCC 11201]|uniref:hypothetical protein n=1 Tax=Planktothrix sp. PCC 11201 TaxID=1729650 RepID=UPI00090F7FD8|nr:hypothetical protein [Planktothrix sp. PCC 11201]SKB13846.1 membrane hypothetical protein [Planktothrix sp. PCC 11201]
MIRASLYIPQKFKAQVRFFANKSFNMHHFWWIVISSVNILVLCSVHNKILNATLTMGNLCLAVLVRNEVILHFLYNFAVESSKVFEKTKYYINTSVHYIGGVHASAATWSFIWLCLDYDQQFKSSNKGILLTTASVLIILMLVMILTAIPLFREYFHNSFEKIHRYVGWSCLAILNFYLVLSWFISNNQRISVSDFFTDPIFLMLWLITGSIILPWVTVQRFDNFIICCSSPKVAILTIPGEANLGTFARISTDFIEWHSFSVAGTSFNPQTGQSQIQLIIGSAGDWTRNLIEKVQAGSFPKYLWVRRVKPPGFMFSINAYSRVVVVATGAGIAPVLLYLEKTDKVYILWIGNNHQTTYGKKIWSLISKHPHLKIYDTGVLGRPNVSDLTIQAAKEFRAQAVFCVSNRAITKSVVSACLDKKIHAYGASWDS